MKCVRITNNRHLDAELAAIPLRPESANRDRQRTGSGMPARPVTLVQMVGGNDMATLNACYGTPLGQLLTEHDHDINLRWTGEPLPEGTSPVWVDDTGLPAEPRFVTAIGDDVTEEPWVDRLPTVYDGDKTVRLPFINHRAHITGPLERAIRLVHTDGLTFDFAYRYAGWLAINHPVPVLAPKGEPLVFSRNGRPWAGILRGVCLGDRYSLVLYLTPWRSP